MKRFAFRLDRVLKVRKRVEERIERELSMKRAEFIRITGRIRDVKDRLADFARENSMTGIFSALDMIAVDNYIFRLGIKIKELEEFKESCERELNRVNEALVEARKARKVIENLRERQFSRYQEEIKRWEDAEIDDINQHIGHTREVLTVEDALTEDM